MPRGYRRIFLAFVGLAAAALLWSVYDYFSAAAEQQHASYKYQPANKPGFRIDASTKAPAQKYQPSCNNPKDGNDADLCAQWAAVEQVAESNRLNGVNVRLGTLALLFTIVGTGLLIWTFMETRAVSRRELRAYVNVDVVGLADGTHHPDRQLPLGVVQTAIVIKNTGQTPAHKLRHWGEIAIERMENQSQLRAPKPLILTHAVSLPSNGTQLKVRHIPRKPSKRQIEGIVARRYAVFVYGRIEYSDVFEDAHWTDYRMFYTGPWPPPLNVSLYFSESGNESD